MPKSAPAAPPPPSALSVESLDQADKLLLELAEMDQHEAAVNATLNRQVAHHQKLAADRMFREVGSEKVAYGDRRQQIAAALETFLDGRRDNLLDGKKSIDLAHGTLGYRAGRAAVVPCDGETEKGIVGRLADKLLKKLMDALSNMAIGVGCYTADVLTLSLGLNKRAILEKYEARQITAAQLEKLGLQVQPSEDRFYATPAKLEMPSFPTHPEHSGD